MDSEVLLRFINGESPEAEQLAIARWMAANPANRAEVTLLREAWALAATPRAAPQPGVALWARIAAQIDAEPAAGGTAPGARGLPPARAGGTPRVLQVVPRAHRTWWNRPHTRLAAAACVLVAVTVGVRQLNSDRPAAVPDPERVYATRAGERAQLQLADGSRVTLAGASTLRIPQSFGRTTRDLYLDGEAYFEVAHDSTRPLRVHTARSTAEDIGTRFVVTAWSEDSTERVAVTEGIVALRSSVEAEPVVLRARDVGRVSASGRVSAERGVATERYMAWLSGVVHFDDVPLGEAAQRLERLYGIEIRISGESLARRRFTGSIRASSLHADLRGLALLLDAQLERRGSAVMLTPAPLPQRGR